MRSSQVIYGFIAVVVLTCVAVIGLTLWRAVPSTEPPVMTMANPEKSSPPTPPAPDIATESPPAPPQPEQPEQPATRRVHGLVTDAETGAPIARAAIEISWPISEEKTDSRVIKSGGDGIFDASVPDRWFVSLHCSADGYIRDDAHYEEVKGDLQHDFILRKGDVIQGFVVDALGRTVEGARITAHGAMMDDGKGGQTNPFDGRPDLVTSDAQGAFMIKGLVPDRGYTLYAFARGAKGEAPGRPDGASVTIRMKPRSELSGLVVTKHGAAVTDATLYMLNLSEFAKLQNPFGAKPVRIEPMITEADGSTRRILEADGRFRIMDLTPGQYKLEARSTSGGWGESEIITIAEGQVIQNLPLILSIDASITGRVITSAGVPVNKATVIRMRLPDNPMAAAVIVPEMMGGGTDTNEQTNTGKDGSFIFASLAPGSYRLWTRAEGMPESITNVTVDDVNPSPKVEIVMAMAGRIHGVYYMNGAPVADAFVILYKQGVQSNAKTDADGAYVIENIYPGEYIITIILPQMDAGMRQSEQARHVTIPEGGDVEMNFGDAQPGMTVSGMVSPVKEGWQLSVVLSPAGAPSPYDAPPLENPMDLDAMMDRMRDIGGMASVQPDGRFTVAGVPPGQYTLYVSALDTAAMEQIIQTLGNATGEASEKEAMLNTLREMMKPIYSMPVTVGDKPVEVMCQVDY